MSFSECYAFLKFHANVTDSSILYLAHGKFILHKFSERAVDIVQTKHLSQQTLF